MGLILHARKEAAILRLCTPFSDRDFSSLHDREQREAAREEAQSGVPQLEKLIARVKVVQKDIEEDISGLYEGRKVNLIGDINAL